jgi:hypothetical protein
MAILLGLHKDLSDPHFDSVYLDWQSSYEAGEIPAGKNIISMKILIVFNSCKAASL